MGLGEFSAILRGWFVKFILIKYYQGVRWTLKAKSNIFYVKSKKSWKNVWRIDLNQLSLHRYPEYNLFTLKTNTY